MPINSPFQSPPKLHFRSSHPKPQNLRSLSGEGAFGFRRHNVAEYPVTIPSTGDPLTEIAEYVWNSRRTPPKPFDPKIISTIYHSELRVSNRDHEPVPLHKLMILESSQYFEKYLWPHFDPETASYEHVMSIVLMVNEKFRENVPAWVSFHDRDEVFRAFWLKVLQINVDKGKDFSCTEKTNYLVFMINGFQSLDDEVVRENVLRLAGLQCLHSLSYGRFQMELHQNPDLMKKWCKLIKVESKKAKNRGEGHDPWKTLEETFLRNLIVEFLGILDAKEFHDGFVFYCERFVEFLIDLLSQLATRRCLRPLVADLAVVAKCHLTGLYVHEKGQLFSQLVGLLRFYETFAINDQKGTQLTDNEVLQAHYDRFKSFQMVAFKKIPKLRDLALANVAAVHERLDLSKSLSLLSYGEL